MAPHAARSMPDAAAALETSITKTYVGGMGARTWRQQGRRQLAPVSGRVRSPVCWAAGPPSTRTASSGGSSKQRRANSRVLPLLRPAPARPAARRIWAARPAGPHHVLCMLAPCTTQLGAAPCALHAGPINYQPCSREPHHVLCRRDVLHTAAAQLRPLVVVQPAPRGVHRAKVLDGHLVHQRAHVACVAPAGREGQGRRRRRGCVTAARQRMPGRQRAPACAWAGSSRQAVPAATVPAASAVSGDCRSPRQRLPATHRLWHTQVQPARLSNRCLPQRPS